MREDLKYNSHMGLFNKLNTLSAIDRLAEEKIYEQVSQEIKLGKRSEGVWTKAMAKSEGDINKAESLYIELRVQSIKDELISNSQHNTNASRKTKDEGLDDLKQDAEKWLKQKKFEKDYRRPSGSVTTSAIVFCILGLIILLSFIYYEFIQ